MGYFQFRLYNNSCSVLLLVVNYFSELFVKCYSISISMSINSVILTCFDEGFKAVVKQRMQLL